ncbi:peptidoglycan-binding protein [Kitasatospora sp. NPDC059571]|uniref:peptidoglycan-binding protein n=1 Tax=Kitasatospora sp. NPDC059571 TaxID=3346871 RepID=UPI0036BBE112
MEFTEVEPDSGCGCPGCGARRLARLHAARPADGGHRSARGARRAAVLVAAVGSVLGGTTGAIAAVPRAATADAPAPGSPQGEVAGPYGDGAPGARALTTSTTTRAEIMARAQGWVDQKVPYSMGRFWSDGYRQDCSGFISMAWGLGSSQTTWTLPNYADRISKDDLQPGDALIYNNSADPQGGSHAVLFGGWTDSSHTRYTAYEQTSPTTVKRSTPYAYWSHSGSYLPYRYRGVTTPPAADPDAFPGAGYFGPGQRNAYVQRLGEMLVKAGAGAYYAEGPDQSWGEADQRATQAFQQAQGWAGAEADGLPGKDTWDLLVRGKGRSIPPTAPRPVPPPPVPAAPAFPGPAFFAPGQVNDWVKLLGEQLVRKGYGRFYTIGPDREWGEADRRNVEAFQLARGWSGAEADGYPGPDTWRLLFS